MVGDQQFYNFLLTVVVGLTTVAGSVVAWWVSTIWGMVKAIQLQVTELNVELVKNYVPRAELQATFDRILNKLDSIQTELRNDRNH